MTKAKIDFIGKNAISSKEDLIILFGEDATEPIKEVSVIQSFFDPSEQKHFEFKNNDQLLFGNQDFTAIYVGKLVQENMRTLGHATVSFVEKVPDAPMENTIYLKKEVPFSLPKIKLGDEITYLNRN